MPRSAFEPRRLHPAARMYAREYRAGELDRREFLTRATALGVGSAAAYGLIGAAGPARAQLVPRAGGTMRVQMSVRALRDTRTYDWSEMGNQTRGTLEYLIEYNNDGSFRGMLLAGWEANEDATEYRLSVRQGVRWSNGDPFTSEDVARNIARWCDTSLAGNSMAARMASLVDPATGQARDGAIAAVDSHTVVLRPGIPDISLIPGMADYPAAIVHSTYDPGDLLNTVGTGPYRIVDYIPGSHMTLERRADPAWWGSAVYGGPYLDRIEYRDFGTDPASWLDALERGDVDMLYESVGDFVEALDQIAERSVATTASTIVIRPNQKATSGDATPYADLRVRQAIQLAVDNAICLELGYGNRGRVAENHHVAPIHPEYAPMPPLPFDPARARALMIAAGYGDFEHELISVDDDWRAATTDAVAALLTDAGIRVRRTLIPRASYAVDWATYAFSSTAWNHRPLGVQIHALAYKSGTAWNEFGWSNPAFDTLLTEALSIADAERRRSVMERMQSLIRTEAVTIQPYWRNLYRHMRPGLVGTEMHIAFEHHHYKWAFAA